MKVAENRQVNGDQVVAEVDNGPVEAPLAAGDPKGAGFHRLIPGLVGVALAVAQGVVMTAAN